MNSSALLAPVVPTQEPVGMTKTLFVATNLDAWETGSPESFSQEVTIRGVAFKCLDPAYYAWLRRCMDRARVAHESGRLAPPAFEELRAKFNEVHAWTVAEFGQAILAEAIRTAPRIKGPLPGAPDLAGIIALPSDPGDWPPILREEFEERAAIIGEDESLSVEEAEAIAREQFMARVKRAPTPAPPPEHACIVARPPAPSAHLFPATGEYRFTERVSTKAVAMVDAIRDRALALGWSLVGLYRNRSNLQFPCGPDWGLVTFLHDGRRLGEVTRQNIEIINPGLQETRSQFPNMEVEQPWLKRVPKTASPSGEKLWPINRTDAVTRTLPTCFRASCSAKCRGTSSARSTLAARACSTRSASSSSWR